MTLPLLGADIDFGVGGGSGGGLDLLAHCRNLYSWPDLGSFPFHLFGVGIGLAWDGLRAPKINQQPPAYRYASIKVPWFPPDLATGLGLNSWHRGMAESPTLLWPLEQSPVYSVALRTHTAESKALTRAF